MTPAISEYYRSYEGGITMITKGPVFEAPFPSLAQIASMFALMHYVGDLELENILSF